MSVNAGLWFAVAVDSGPRLPQPEVRLMAMEKCPKCGSTAIESGQLVSAGGVSFKSDKHRAIFHQNARSYACLDCGYVETYVDPEYREKVRRQSE